MSQVSERLLAQRTAAQAVVAAWEAKLSAAPTWWPEQGGDLHRERLREAEKALLAEEARYGRLHPRPLAPGK